MAAASRSTRSARLVTCSACGTKYGEEAWGTLAVSQRIEAGEVRRHVIAWPDDLMVEVRVCGSCSRLIARKR